MDGDGLPSILPARRPRNVNAGGMGLPPDFDSTRPPPPERQRRGMGLPPDFVPARRPRNVNAGGTGLPADVSPVRVFGTRRGVARRSAFPGAGKTGDNDRRVGCPRCGRAVHGGRAARPLPLLHEPRRRRLRPAQPARGGEGGVVRPLLALGQVAAAALPRRVPRRGAGRPGRRGGGRRRAGGPPLRAGARGVRRRLGGPARGRPRRLRGGLEPVDEGARAGAAGRVPRAVDPLRAVHRPARGALEVPGSPGNRRAAPARAIRLDPGRCVRDLPPVARARAGPLPPPVSQHRGRLGGRVPGGHPGQGPRHAAGAPARRHPVERRRLRLGPGVRGPAAAHAGPSAGRGAHVRGPDAGRAAEADSRLPHPGRPRGPRGAVEPLPGGYASRGRRRGGAPARGGGPRPRARGGPDRLRPGRRGEGGRGGAVRVVPAARAPAPRDGPRPGRGRAGRGAARLRRRPRQPPPPSRGALSSGPATASTCSPTTARSATCSAIGS